MLKLISYKIGQQPGEQGETDADDGAHDHVLNEWTILEDLDDLLPGRHGGRHQVRIGFFLHKKVVINTVITATTP